MKYNVRFARNSDIDNIQRETVNAENEQAARDMFTVCDCWVYSVEPADEQERLALQWAEEVYTVSAMSKLEKTLLGWYLHVCNASPAHVAKVIRVNPDVRTTAQRWADEDAADLRNTYESARY